MKNAMKIKQDYVTENNSNTNNTNNNHTKRNVVLI